MLGSLGSLGSALVVAPVIVVGSVVVVLVVLVLVLGPGSVVEVVGFGSVVGPTVVGCMPVLTGVDEASSLLPLSVPSLSRVRPEHAGSVRAVNIHRSEARAR
jgi:hypothetical protein